MFRTLSPVFFCFVGFWRRSNQRKPVNSRRQIDPSSFGSYVQSGAHESWQNQTPGQNYGLRRSPWGDSVSTPKIQPSSNPWETKGESWKFKTLTRMEYTQAATTATATKTWLENKHLRNDDYLVIFASSSQPLFLTGHAANEPVEAPLK